MDKLIDTIKKGLSIAVTEAGKLTKTVAGKTNNLVDVTKLNLALNETERKISGLYEKTVINIPKILNQTNLYIKKNLVKYFYKKRKRKNDKKSKS